MCRHFYTTNFGHKSRISKCAYSLVDGRLPNKVLWNEVDYIVSCHFFTNVQNAWNLISKYSSDNVHVKLVAPCFRCTELGVAMFRLASLTQLLVYTKVPSAGVPSTSSHCSSSKCSRTDWAGLVAQLIGCMWYVCGDWVHASVRIPSRSEEFHMPNSSVEQRTLLCERQRKDRLGFPCGRRISVAVFENTAKKIKVRSILSTQPITGLA